MTEDSVKIASWSLIPATGLQLCIRDGLLVMNTSRVLCLLVGKLTTCEKPYSCTKFIIVSHTARGYAAPSVQPLTQSMFGKLRSPTSQIGELE